MLRFVKQIFISAMIFSSCNLSNVNPLKCVSMKNWECKIRPEIVNANSGEPTFLPQSFKMNKCRGSSNNINEPYAKMCIPYVKNINLKVFNLM